MAAAHDGRVALILDGVMTPVNVGSIVRLAAAYGASPLWLAGATAHPVHPGAQKTAMGTDRFVEVITGVDRGRGRRRQPTTTASGSSAWSWPTGAVPLHELEVHRRRVPGARPRGPRPELGRPGRCDAVAYLPLVGRVGSLNVATAAGIALYELRRREWVAAREDRRLRGA